MSQHTPPEIAAEIAPAQHGAARRVALHLPEAVACADDTPALSPAFCAEIAVGLAGAEGLWRPHVSHDPLSRTSVRLIATHAYEVWLLGWTTDQHVEFHDHGPANAAFVVVDGILDEYTLTADGTRRQRLHHGEVGTVPAGTVHDVCNPAAANATSLHVYSNPLRRMTFYDAARRPRFTEVVEDVAPLIDGRHAGPVPAPR